MSIYHTKGQVTVEFVIALFVLIIGMMFVYNDFSRERQRTLQELFDLRMKNFVDRTASILNTAFIEGEGYVTVTEMPELEYDYSIVIDSNYMLLRINNKSYSSLLIFSDVSGNLTSSQENTVRNENGVVVIS